MKFDKKKFYNQKDELYFLNNNSSFLNQYKNMIDDGYDTRLNIKQLQNLIDNIATWYEVKYSEREIKKYVCSIDDRFKKIERSTKQMNFHKLMQILPDKQQSLIKCYYRAKDEREMPIYSNKEITCFETHVFLPIVRKNKLNNYVSWVSGEDAPSFLVCARSRDGKITIDYNIKKIGNLGRPTLENLLKLLKKEKTNYLDYSELKSCIKNHNCDLELRNALLNLISLKLLFSENTTPKVGYRRALRFINEFNQNIPQLNLSTDKIDEIMSNSFKDESKDEDIILTQKSKKLVRGRL